MYDILIDIWHIILLMYLQHNWTLINIGLNPSHCLSPQCTCGKKVGFYTLLDLQSKKKLSKAEEKKPKKHFSSGDKNEGK